MTTSEIAVLTTAIEHAAENEKPILEEIRRQWAYQAERRAGRRLLAAMIDCVEIVPQRLHDMLQEYSTYAEVTDQIGG